MLVWLPENLNVQGNIEDNFQGQGQGLTVQGRGQGQGLAVQGQDQELETQDQGRGQLASTVLDGHVLEDSISDEHKRLLRTVHCLQYCTVHLLFHDKKIMTGGLGGSQDPQDPPLATPMRLGLVSIL